MGTKISLINHSLLSKLLFAFFYSVIRQCFLGTKRFSGNVPYERHLAAAVKCMPVPLIPEGNEGNCSG